MGQAYSMEQLEAPNATLPTPEIFNAFLSGPVDLKRALVALIPKAIENNNQELFSILLNKLHNTPQIDSNVIIEAINTCATINTDNTTKENMLFELHNLHQSLPNTFKAQTVPINKNKPFGINNLTVTIPEEGEITKKGKSRQSTTEVTQDPTQYPKELPEKLLAIIPVAITINTKYITNLLTAAKKENPDFQINASILGELEKKAADPLIPLKDILEKMQDPIFNDVKKQAFLTALPHALASGNTQVVQVLLENLKTDTSVKQPTLPLTTETLLKTLEAPSFNETKKTALKIAMSAALKSNSTDTIKRLWGSLKGTALIEAKQQCLQIALQTHDFIDTTAIASIDTTVLSFILKNMKDKKYAATKQESLYTIINTAEKKSIPPVKIGLLLDAVKSKKAKIAAIATLTDLKNKENMPDDHKKNIQQLLKLPALRHLQKKDKKTKVAVTKETNTALGELKSIPGKMLLCKILQSATLDTDLEKTHNFCTNMCAFIQEKQPERTGVIKFLDAINTIFISAKNQQQTKNDLLTTLQTFLSNELTNMRMVRHGDAKDDKATLETIMESTTEAQKKTDSDNSIQLSGQLVTPQTPSAINVAAVSGVDSADELSQPLTSPEHDTQAAAPVNTNVQEPQHAAPHEFSAFMQPHPVAQPEKISPRAALSQQFFVDIADGLSQPLTSPEHDTQVAAPVNTNVQRPPHTDPHEFAAFMQNNRTPTPPSAAKPKTLSPKAQSQKSFVPPLPSTSSMDTNSMLSQSNASNTPITFAASTPLPSIGPATPKRPPNPATAGTLQPLLNSPRFTPGHDNVTKILRSQSPPRRQTALQPIAHTAQKGTATSDPPLNPSIKP